MKLPLAIIYTPEAEASLLAIESYIAVEASPETADKFVGGILAKCESLADFPRRGTPRDDLRSGIRTVPYRRRVTIAYEVDEEAVTILGVFYAGQEVALSDFD